MGFPVGPKRDEGQVVTEGEAGGKGIGPSRPAGDDSFDIGHAERTEQALLQPCVIAERP